MAGNSTVVAEQFDDLDQQRTAKSFGMWIFLVTEMMLFGGLFLAYFRYRIAYPQAFDLGGRQTDFWLGSINTVVLLTSSLTMALAVNAGAEGRRWRLPLCLLATMALGSLFLVIKGYEYHEDYTKSLVPGIHFSVGSRVKQPVPGLNTTSPDRQQENAALFFTLYFFMTGLHAIHLTVGICLVGLAIVLAMNGRLPGDRSSMVELTGLYWHLIDIVWVFLYPMFYLIGRHG